jgi:hypothetical protein
MARDGEKKIIDKILKMAEEESTTITAEAQKKAGEIKKDGSPGYYQPRQAGGKEGATAHYCGCPPQG